MMSHSIILLKWNQGSDICISTSYSDRYIFTGLLVTWNTGLLDYTLNCCFQFIRIYSTTFFLEFLFKVHFTISLYSTWKIVSYIFSSDNQLKRWQHNCFVCLSDHLLVSLFSKNTSALRILHWNKVIYIHQFDPENWTKKITQSSFTKQFL